MANQTLWDAQVQAEQNINNSHLTAQQIINDAKFNAHEIINKAKQIMDEANQAKENIAQNQSIDYLNEILAKAIDAKKECDFEISKLVNPLGDEQKFIVLSKLMKLNILKNNSESFNEYQRLVKLYSGI